MQRNIKDRENNEGKENKQFDFLEMTTEINEQRERNSRVISVMEAKV